jgi:restriction endonuclease-like protein
VRIMTRSTIRTKRWTRLEYERLIDLGAFQPGDRVELVGGDLMVCEPQGTPHMTGIRMAEEVLRQVFADGWEVRTQAPVALDDESEPEPDVVVALPWTVELEWVDRTSLLSEPRATQVDAIARGRHTIILFECKFTESDGGHCSQTNRRPSTRKPQCDGNYRLQTNPTNGVKARCALSGKGIKYWSVIPTVFTYLPDADYAPCPFAGPWFQWMRNITLCQQLAQKENRTPAFVVVYADSPLLLFPSRLQSDDWKSFLATVKPDAMTVATVSYQTLVRQAFDAVKHDAVLSDRWTELDQWMSRKISMAEAQRSPSQPG